MSKVRANLKRKTQRIELKFSVEEIYKKINPGNAGEEYLAIHSGMTITGIAKYSLETFQYLLAEHHDWTSGFVNLWTSILCIKALNKLQFLC